MPKKPERKKISEIQAKLISGNKRRNASRSRAGLNKMADDDYEKQLQEWTEWSPKEAFALYIKNVNSSLSGANRLMLLNFIQEYKKRYPNKTFKQLLTVIRDEYESYRARILGI